MPVGAFLSPNSALQSLAGDQFEMGSYGRSRNMDLGGEWLNCLRNEVPTPESWREDSAVVFTRRLGLKEQ